ncbi:hypothetical protein P5V15_006949 [Pogonomyrmex californicus]
MLYLQKEYRKRILMDICDWRLKIMNTNAHYPGNIHDDFLWIMTPVTGAAENSPEAAYNTKQIRCRSSKEQCNEVLKRRFRCLLRRDDCTILLFRVSVIRI